MPTARGKVVTIYGRYYTVECGGKRLTCVLRGKLRKDPRLEKYSEPVAVGDMVEVDMESSESGAIAEVLDRRNLFTRKYKDSDREDIIAANLDQIVIIQCFGKPAYNLRFVDRLLVRAVREDIPALLCMNKSDLSDRASCRYVADYYRGSNLRILTVSAVTGSGMDELKSLLTGSVSICLGNSGVGKTSIINRLYPGYDLPTAEVSRHTGKGRHTTTNVSMLTPDQGTGIIDTPGLREFGLLHMTPEELGTCFMEYPLYAAECEFHPCTHDHEPGCAVKRRVRDGEIHRDRHISYLHILSSLREYRRERYR